ncbi:oxaloacetate acetylhydrolase [Lentinula aciculospora]|uniref:Oxaloacetate acetylhydrolase n=1 Tax=Lentinula aciculospora TaxID=153920 RepID=A0A9W8ZXW5_9AGAR|nr:oxaloacetate acetylhydrolase [Lentinula aciculospora]
MEPYTNPRLDPENFKDGPLSTINPATRLRQMLARPGAIIAPGVYDGVSTRLAVEAGFHCLYQRFGGPNMIARTVTQYARVGVAGLHIEDQVQTKRCVSTEELVTRIRAAVLGRDSIPGGSDTVIIARTAEAQGLGLEEAIYRLKFASAAGADVLFLEGVRSKEDLEFTSGFTPNFTAKEAEALGVKIIIYPLITVIPTIHDSRYTSGSDVESVQGMGPKKFFQVMGLDDAIKLDAIAGATSLNSI